jgi:DNA-binding CsgD family transcriptional regulator
MNLPLAPVVYHHVIAQMWRQGLDTLQIARRLHIRECAVYNSLPAILLRIAA